MIKTAIFASGSGTNAMNIIHFFRDSAVVSIEAVLSNKPDAPVLQKAAAEGVETLIFSRDDFYNNSIVYNYLSKKGIELIILAGFLWLVPENMVNTWQGRIVNIHPALLPSYGGRGMYGDKVHKAVIENGEKQSGISIHLVNPKYDEGDILFQACCPVLPDDTPESLAARIHQLEYRYFPQVIEQLAGTLLPKK